MRNAKGRETQDCETRDNGFVPSPEVPSPVSNRIMNREKEVYKVTLWGSLVNVVLVVFKFVAVIVGHSSAMIADAVHSVSDFATDIVVLAFVRISHKLPFMWSRKGNEYHPVETRFIASQSRSINII